MSERTPDPRLTRGSIWRDDRGYEWTIREPTLLGLVLVRGDVKAPQYVGLDDLRRTWVFVRTPEVGR